MWPSTPVRPVPRRPPARAGPRHRPSRAAISTPAKRTAGAPAAAVSAPAIGLGVGENDDAAARGNALLSAVRRLAARGPSSRGHAPPRLARRRGSRRGRPGRGRGKHHRRSRAAAPATRSRRRRGAGSSRRRQTRETRRAGPKSRVPVSATPPRLAARSKRRRSSRQWVRAMTGAAAPRSRRARPRQSGRVQRWSRPLPRQVPHASVATVLQPRAACHRARRAASWRCGSRRR